MLSEEDVLNLLIDNLTWFLTSEGVLDPLYESQVKKAAHAIAERMRERVIFSGEYEVIHDGVSSRLYTRTSEDYLRWQGELDADVPVITGEHVRVYAMRKEDDRAD